MAMLASILGEIAQRIADASMRAPLQRAVRLVAVGKLKPVEAIRAVYDLGQRDFGENYFQEMKDKASTLPLDIRWHFIGHLQSGKCKLIARIPNVYMVHTIDTVKLATALNKACAHEQRTMKVLVQVNSSGEQSKSGCPPQECTSVVQHILNECRNLEFCGLMTIGDFNDIPDDRCFNILSECRQRVANECDGTDINTMELSMGMSNDYQLAIERGATLVRIGSTIFGQREKK